MPWYILWLDATSKVIYLKVINLKKELQAKRAEKDEHLDSLQQQCDHWQQQLAAVSSLFSLSVVGSLAAFCHLALCWNVLDKLKMCLLKIHFMINRNALLKVKWYAVDICFSKHAYKTLCWVEPANINIFVIQNMCYMVTWVTL